MGPNDVGRHLLILIAVHATQHFDGRAGGRCVDLAIMLRRCFACSAIAWKICVQAMTGLRTI
jgi:hypothetical protein